MLHGAMNDDLLRQSAGDHGGKPSKLRMLVDNIHGCAGALYVAMRMSMFTLLKLGNLGESTCLHRFLFWDFTVA
jgi:hypothetical protein